MTKTHYHEPSAGPVTLLQACDEDLQQLSQRVGRDRSRSTYVRQCRLRQLLADFLATRTADGDLPLGALDSRFIHDYAAWLSSRRRYRGGTVWLACQQLRGVVSRACQRGLLGENPFYGFHIGRNIRPREYLTEQELQQVMGTPLDDTPALARYRDLFVFAALTGMSFVDINLLQRDDIRTIGNELWVVSRRHKTHTPYQVRLLPPAASIIRRYDHGTPYIFGPLNYRTLAKHMPDVIRRCGIGRHVTFHCARHTFAVMSLDAGLPIESVSRVLGHTSISTTQIYARITMQKLRSDMDRLEHFLAEAWPAGEE